MDLQDKVAIVTGSANGIGRAAAVRFAAEGADVVIADIDAEGLNRTNQLVVASGRRYLPVVCDVAVDSDVEDLVEHSIRWTGTVDLLMNNVGAAIGGRWCGDSGSGVGWPRSGQRDAVAVLLGRNWSERPRSRLRGHH